MRIICCDRKPELIQEWEKGGLESYCGDIFSRPCDAIVSPANSFGFMDGGIDLAYSHRFGWGVQQSVQAKIKSDFDGELLIGQALAVDTGDAQFPVLISAPTMRVPMDIPDPNHVRMATKSAIRLALKLGVGSVVIPGMGAGCGQVRANVVAAMMKAGIDDALNHYSFPKSLHEASNDHYDAYPEGF